MAGPNIETCGTPNYTSTSSDVLSFTCTNCHLSRMYNLEFSAERALGNPFCAILFKNPGVIDHVERL